jgi:hypothetical protein
VFGEKYDVEPLLDIDPTQIAGELSKLREKSLICRFVGLRPREKPLKIGSHRTGNLKGILDLCLEMLRYILSCLG